MKRLISSISFLATISIAVNSEALVLCAPKGAGAGTCQEGGGVVIREVCQASESTLRPFTISSNGDITEVSPRNKTETIGLDSSITVANSSARIVGNSDAVSVGGDARSEVAGSSSSVVGATRTETVGGNETITIGADRSESIGGFNAIAIEKDMSVDVGGAISQSAVKNYQVIAGKKLFLEAADEITLKTGGASIMMKKNGDVTISGKRISVKGKGAVTIKGSKVNSN